MLEDLVTPISTRYAPENFPYTLEGSNGSFAPAAYSLENAPVTAPLHRDKLFKILNMLQRSQATLNMHATTSNHYEIENHNDIVIPI